MHKLLVIEDDYSVRTSLVDILESAGYKVYSVADGNSGISLAKEIIPDLILCDILMPGLDGYGVFEKLKDNDKTNIIPFIFLTAKTTIGDITTGLGMGADDYIIKPFRAKELINRIKIRIDKFEKLKRSFANAEIDEKDLNKNIKLDEKSSIFLTVDNQPTFVKISSIMYIVAQAEYTKIFLENGKKIFIRKLLKQWENILPVSLFRRIHRSTIINMSFIEKIERWSKRSYAVRVKNVDETLIISERYATKLRKEIGL